MCKIHVMFFRCLGGISSVSRVDNEGGSFVDSLLVCGKLARDWTVISRVGKWPGSGINVDGRN